jgi:ABC-type transport system involved in multi-copper enzyme maturation permease subunit
MSLSLIGYREWTGSLRGAWLSPWPIARTALRMLFRRKLFWILYIVALLNFLVFTSCIYVLSQIDIEELARGERMERARMSAFLIPNLQEFVDTLRLRLHLAGTGATYRNFFWLQGYIVMAVLSMAGAILIGNDYQHGSLPFYLSKPLGRWHYLAGKCLAVAFLINLMTTIPALVIYAECGLLNAWPTRLEEGDCIDAKRLLLGILGYGAILSVCLSLLVVALASWLRKTVPLIMVWVGILFFARLVAAAMVNWLGYHENWRLIDLWNNMYVVGCWCLDVSAKLTENRRVWTNVDQPDVWKSAAVLGAMCILCLIYLNRRIRAVEIIR